LPADCSTIATLLKDQLTSKVAGNWQVHVRWRESVLLASFMPPYQEAFELWYRPEELLRTMTHLCPAADDAIWQMLTPDQDIVMEPTVGGKITVEMRVSCRKRLHSTN
jgi:hypothetical protein